MRVLLEFLNMQASVAWQLWTSLRRAQANLAGFPGEYPNCNNAVAQLEQAMRAELPHSRWAARSRRTLAHKREARKLQQRARRLQKKCDDLKAKLEAATGAQRVQKHLRTEWLVRVCPAAPTVSMRSLERSFRDACGSERTVVSRTSISKIRDAFVEVTRDMVTEKASETVRRAAKYAGDAAFYPLVLTHLHDEACLRLRSFLEDRPSCPTRSRTSKVQQHVTTLHAYGTAVAIPQDAEALAEQVS